MTSVLIHLLDLYFSIMGNRFALLTIKLQKEIYEEVKCNGQPHQPGKLQSPQMDNEDE